MLSPAQAAGLNPLKEVTKHAIKRRIHGYLPGFNPLKEAIKPAKALPVLAEKL
ncbi:hypothetical protein [Desulfofundulus kuznetsovii]|uniref:hypothetical protein n=1 Tax=Desulfofundulus kuznetsovii TaxID=58135 RepID=UPI00030E542C